MAIQRYTTCTWMLIWVFAAALFVTKVDQARAQSSSIPGAGAAGLLLGLVIGGTASQSQGQSKSQRTTEGRSYTSCGSIYGPGAVNSSSNPGKCVCQTGFRWTSEGGSLRCIRGGTDTAQGTTRNLNTGTKPATKSATKPTHSPAELEKIQESLNLLGYDAGSVDGEMGQQTQQAILRFQTDKKFAQTGNLSAAEQRILFKDVEAKRSAESSRQQPVPPDRGSPSQAAQDRSTPKPDARVELAHWDSVRNSKIPGELEDYIARYPNGEFTKLASLRLEQVKAEVAKEEEERKPKRVEPNRSVSGTTPLPPIDEAAYPKAKQRRADAVAVIIGNSAYRNGVPSVDYGVRDAEAMKLMAIKTLGLDSGNIIFLKDATRGAMGEVFGTDTDYKGRLWRLIDPDGRSDVYIFYSGHGVPGVNNIEGNFLLPVDGDPNHASLNGYPLSLLYKNLGELKTKSITVFLDACFSGQSPDASSTSLIKHASPVFISKATPSDSSKINVFAAASERQLSSWDTEAGHGMFTRYVLAGLAGEADEDKNREVTAKELHDYVSRQVRRAARRTHGREQEPQFTGNAGFVLSSF